MTGGRAGDWWRRRSESAWAEACAEFTPEELQASAIVVAPHPDDETLGCGGTIARKLAAGASVSVVVMTDGRTSHAAWGLEASALIAMREAEAIAAARQLGIAPRDVHFLRFVDGQLAIAREEAANALAAVVQRLRPEQVFVPSSDDGQPDHEATAAIGWSLARRNPEMRVLEYPVWEWNAWPWVAPPRLSVRRRDLGPASRYWTRSVRGAATGVRRRFTHRVDITRSMDTKRAALARHRSQTEELQPGWPTLGSVGDGSFLANFFTGYEYFRANSPSGR